MKSLKESLKESLLSNVETTLDNGDNIIRRIYSTGNILQIESIYGDKQVLKQINGTKLGY